MEELLFKIIIVSVMIVVSWKLILESIYESFKDDSNLKKAVKELPILAKELKLKRKKGDEFGMYYGWWNEHQIRIEPNHYQTSIGIKINGDPKFSAAHIGVSKTFFHINNLYHALTKIIIKFIPGYPVAESKSPMFSFNDDKLDKYFQERLLSDDIGKDIALNSELKNELRNFLEKNNKIVRNLIIGTEVSCSLWLGNSIKPRLSSVTGTQAKYMLSEMLPLTVVIEKNLKHKPRIQQTV